jgi:phenylalanyl-tRNA synthetase beta chain
MRVVEAVPYVAPQIALRLNKLNNLTGLSLSKAEAEAILKALQIKIVNTTEEGWLLEAPSNKPDVTREVDVIEEILRIYGFDRVPLPERLSISINYSAKPEPFQLRNKAMQHLCSMGFNEMMALSITNDKFATQVLGLKDEQVVRVHNTANQNLDSLRASLLPGMLEAVERNQNRQNPDLRLAEFGKAYLREDADTFHEEERLGMLITGRRSPENWLNTGKDASTFYTLKGYLSNLLTRLGIDSGVTLEEVAEHAYFDSCIRMKRGKTVLAELGILKPSLLKSFGVKNETFFAEVYWTNVLEVLKTVKTKFTELSKFQNVNRDLALVIDKKVSFAEIQDMAFKTDKKLLREVNLFDVFEDANKLGEGKKSYAVSFTLHNTEATLKDSEVEAIMQKLIAQFETKLQATIRK